jgi:hypothetical protein
MLLVWIITVRMMINNFQFNSRHSRSKRMTEREKVAKRLYESYCINMNITGDWFSLSASGRAIWIKKVA